MQLQCFQPLSQYGTFTENPFFVYNIEGKFVTTLVDEIMNEGYKEVTWHGTDSYGNPVSSGIYFYRLQAGGEALMKKMVLLR